MRYGLEGLWLWPHLGERRVLAVRGLLGRVKVFHISYGDVRTDTELAVFTDVGPVFRNFSNLGSGKIQAVVGGGIWFLAAS